MYICSDHFHPSDFIKQGCRKVLKAFALPRLIGRSYKKSITATPSISTFPANQPILSPKRERRDSSSSSTSSKTEVLMLTYKPTRNSIEPISSSSNSRLGQELKRIKLEHSYA